MTCKRGEKRSRGLFGQVDLEQQSAVFKKHDNTEDYLQCKSKTKMTEKSNMVPIFMQSNTNILSQTNFLRA